MPNAIAFRPDVDGSALRGPAPRSKDAAQARRLISLAAIYDGGSRTEAAWLVNVTLQIVRDWVVRFPHCNTEAMSLHLAEIAAMVSPGRHAVLVLDQISSGSREWAHRY